MGKPSMKSAHRPCIPRSLFMKSLAIPGDGNRAWKIRRSAWNALQHKTERYVADLFRLAEQHAQKEGRVTVQVNDFKEVLR